MALVTFASIMQPQRSYEQLLLCCLNYCTLLLTVGWGDVGTEVEDIMFLYQGILVSHDETAVSSLKLSVYNKI